MDEERIVNTPFPPYFDRFIDERDRRLISELARLETNIHHNLKHIDQLRREIERSIASGEAIRTEAKNEREAGFASAKKDREAGFASAKNEREAGFASAKNDREAIRSDITRLEAKMDSHFRWSIGLMISIVVGILAIIVRVFLIGI